MAEISNFTVNPPGYEPPKPAPPPRESLTIWDGLCLVGVALLVYAGWLVTPAIGIAVLGTWLMVAGVLGSRAAATASSTTTTDRQEESA